MRLDGRPAASAVARASARGSRTPPFIGGSAASARAAAGGPPAGTPELGQLEPRRRPRAFRPARSPVEAHPQPHLGAAEPPERIWTRSAELVARSRARGRWACSAGGRSRPTSGSVDVAAVADGADRARPSSSQTWRLALAAAVLDAVGRRLADREDEVLVAAGVEPGGSGRTGRRGGAPIARSPLPKDSATEGPAERAERAPRAGSRAS